MRFRARRYFRFQRPLVLLQSDDWGRVGLRDHEGLEALRSGGLELGTNPYDFYTLETSDDVFALQEMLLRHRDSTGRPACLVANFILANLDFSKMAAEGYQAIHLRYLCDSLPGAWRRPGLFASYRLAVERGLFYPALHGLTHFCRLAVESALQADDARAQLLRVLWAAETPYIYWRMPWIGFEYWVPENPGVGFLRREMQTQLILQAKEQFVRFFGQAPVSACAPGYRANQLTHAAWRKCGVRVVQNGPGSTPYPFLSADEVLSIGRSLDFEPAQAEPSLDKCLQVADEGFSRGAPLVISVHSINFHSSVKDFRSGTLLALDRFLAALERKYPDLLYVHDGDLYDIVMTGKFESGQGACSVPVERASVAARGKAQGIN